MKPRGFPSRKPKIRGGLQVGRVRIRQWECTVHGVFREYPPFLVRFKHYVAEVIDAALEARKQGDTVEAFCEAWELPDVRTPTRWIAGFVQCLKSVGLKAERRLEGLDALDGLDPGQPGLEPEADTAPAGRSSCEENRWQYAYVWSLLSRLQAICAKAFQSVSRCHFIFTL